MVMISTDTGGLMGQVNWFGLRVGWQQLDVVLHSSVERSQRLCHDHNTTNKVDFSSLPRFKKSITQVDLSQFLKC